MLIAIANAEPLAASNFGPSHAIYYERYVMT